MPVYKPFARGVRLCARGLLAGWRVEGALPACPAVFVVHHQNLSGPIRALALLPCEARLWVLHPFLERGACFAQFYGYTFTRRFGWPRPAAALAAGAAGAAVPPLMRSMGAIPVYRGSRRMRETLGISVQALCGGQHVMLCPDVDYQNAGDAAGQMYSGFLHLEQEYRRRTGRHLAFVPVAESRGKKCVRIGAPVRFEDGVPFRAQRAAVAQRIAEGMNALCGASCYRATPHNSRLAP